MKIEHTSDERKKRIIKLKADGLGNYDIARRFSISPATVLRILKAAKQVEAK